MKEVRVMKKVIQFMVMALVFIGLIGCSSSSGNNEKVLIYSNADEEAIEIMKETLDDNDFKGKYDIQSFGSSELMAKVDLENVATTATNLSFSTFYLETLQDKYGMFKKHNVDISGLLKQYQSEYFLPFLVNTGSIFYNVEVLKEKKLPIPKSIKDLAKPEYKNQISFPNLADSTTGWLLVQSIMDNYDKDEAKEIIAGIKENAGVHIESSGSGPIKQVEAGEVAIGFGLRNQAVDKNKEGLPIKVVDPTEGNYTLTESFAIISDNDSSKKAVKLLFEKCHQKMLEQYPSRLFKDDVIPKENETNTKIFSEKLTLDLLQEHIRFFNAAK